MTRIPFDQFSKGYLEELLTPFGPVERSLEIPGEPTFVDVYFIPAASAEELASLGILGQLLTTASLLEPFRNPPSVNEIRGCLYKLLALHNEWNRQGNRHQVTILEDQLPQTIILGTSISDSVLSDFSAVPWQEELPGLYQSCRANRTILVSIRDLPPTEATLWIRILGKGGVQKSAIEEVMALPRTDPRRVEMLKLLSSWKIGVELAPDIDEEERDLIMALSQAYLEWEQETEARGRQAERQNTLESFLQSRFGSLDETLTALIPVMIELSPSEYSQFLFTLPNLSREELLARFR
jgi:hypothetical protein